MAPVQLDFIALFGLLLGKILALVEGVLDNWVDITQALPGDAGFILTNAGENFTGEISNLVEKIVQLIEEVLEQWFDVWPM